MKAVNKRGVETWKLGEGRGGVQIFDTSLNFVHSFFPPSWKVTGPPSQRGRIEGPTTDYFDHVTLILGDTSRNLDTVVARGRGIRLTTVTMVTQTSLQRTLSENLRNSKCLSIDITILLMYFVYIAVFDEMCGGGLVTFQDGGCMYGLQLDR